MPDDHQHDTHREYHSVKQTAAITGVSEKTIRRAIKAGNIIPSDMSKGGRRRNYRIHRSSIDAWMTSLQPTRAPSTAQASALAADFFPTLIGR